jgi:hypothetical protein
VSLCHNGLIIDVAGLTILVPRSYSPLQNPRSVPAQARLSGAEGVPTIGAGHQDLRTREATTAQDGTERQPERLRIFERA